MSFAVRGWLAVLLIVATGYGALASMRAWRQMPDGVPERREPAVALATPVALDGFRFTERHGEPLDLGALKGRVWVASFFFSSCPGACRLLNQTVAGLQRELIEQGVTIVSISVDPEFDTVEKLAEYAELIGADDRGWLFATGPLSDSQELGERVFGVSVRGKDHTDRLILIDRQGKVRGRFQSSDEMQMKRFRKLVAAAVKERP